MIVNKGELNPEDMLNLFGLTAEAEFVGHIIWAEENSAYLCTDNALATFDTRPEFALVYSTYKEAESTTHKLNKSSKVVFLFDVNNKLQVFSEDKIKNGEQYVISG